MKNYLKHICRLCDRCFPTINSIPWVQYRKKCLFLRVVVLPNVTYVLAGVSAGLLYTITAIYSKVIMALIIERYLILHYVAASIRQGLLDLSSRILGPNSIMQSALPKILSNTPATYFEDVMGQIQVKLYSTL